MVYALDSSMEPEYRIHWLSTDDVKSLLLHSGKPVDVSGLDLRFIKQSNKGKLSDFPYGLGGKFTCSPAFRNVVEELEPNTHQFIPVDVFNKDGSRSDEVIFLVNLLARIDFIDTENSKGLTPLKTLGGNDYFDVDRVDGRFALSIKSEIIGRRHFWRSGGLTFGAFIDHFFCSDEAHDLILSRSLTDINFTPVRLT